MFSITLGFIRWFGFGFGSMVSYAGEQKTIGGLPEKLYKITSYTLDLGAISFALTLRPKPTTEEEMRKEY